MYSTTLKAYIYRNFFIQIRKMSEVIFMVKESDEGGYEASALGHAIFTEADTWEELKKKC